MIEVEAKIRISQKDVKKIEERIQKIARYRGKEEKIDDYYSLENKGYRKKSLRIRKKKDAYEINFKRRISYDKGIHAKNEVEFTTNDLQGFISLIQDFGFKKWLRKEKKTYLYEISKNFHVEINHVKDLGWFLEIEYLCNKDEIKMAKQKILYIMEKLHVNKEDIVKEGYTKLLWDKGITS